MGLGAPLLQLVKSYEGVEGVQGLLAVVPIGPEYRVDLRWESKVYGYGTLQFLSSDLFLFAFICLFVALFCLLHSFV